MLLRVFAARVKVRKIRMSVDYPAKVGMTDDVCTVCIHGIPCHSVPQLELLACAMAWLESVQSSLLQAEVFLGPGCG